MSKWISRLAIRTSLNNSRPGPTHPQDKSPNPAERVKRNAVGRLLAYIALLDLRRLAICFSSAIRSSIRIVTMRSLL